MLWWYWWMVTTLLITFTSYSDAQKCSMLANVVVDCYTLSPRPSNDTINSCTYCDINSCTYCLVTSTGANMPGANMLVTCTGANLPTLIDGMPGPLKSNGSGDKVHAWNHTTTSRIRIIYYLSVPITLHHVNLFFYNIPSMGIGLPDVELYAGASTTPLKYYISGNGNLSQGDDMRRDVLLSLLAPLPSDDVYSVEFVFDNTTVDSLRLSEIIMCNRSNVNGSGVPTSAPSLSPPSNSSIVRGLDDISPNLTLSCTVSGEGRFRWEWTGPGGDSSQVVLSDATRSSTALFTRLVGPGTFSYQCQATYDPGNFSDSQNISVTLQSALEFSGTSTTVRARLFDNVMLSCEMFGYFQQNLSQILWEYDNQLIDSSHPLFDITTSDGSRLIQNGGDHVIPSVVSELSISVEDRTVFGKYLCKHLSNEVIINLLEDTTATPTSSQGGRGGNIFSNSTNVAIIAVAGVLIVIILLVTIAIIILFILCRSRSKNLQQLSSTSRKALDYTGESFYHEMPKPPTPPLNPEIEAYAIVSNIVEHNDSIELRERKSPQATMPFSKEIDTSAFQHSDQLPFIENNPLYASCDNIDDEMPITHRRRKDSLDYTGEPFYEMPKPPMNPEIEAYAIVSNIVEHNDSIELRERKSPQATMPFSKEIDTSAIQHSDQLPFLENNPLYASCHRRRAGSIPSLDVLTDSPEGSQLNIYAQPSLIAPPIPRRPPTPELCEEPIFNEAGINPSVFQFRGRMPSPPPEDRMLPCVSIYADPQPLLRSEGPLEVFPENIKELKKLGVGQFGQVILAETVGLSLKDLRLGENDIMKVSVQVAIKKLKSFAEPHVKEAFEKEIKFMSRLRNKNVVSLLGVCLTDNPFIIMEYMENGDLNQFLHKQVLVADSSTPGEGGLTPKQLTHICCEISSGMKYMATLNFIHRDLATRNCLVGSKLQIKIADFGMSRSLYTSYYYRISGSAMLPIRWMAKECFYGKFSEKTDVWAFGVTMWEVFTFSREQPYRDMSDQEVIDDAVKGPERLLPSKPDCCPSEVFEVMKRCWIDNPDERIGFKTAHLLLEAIHESVMF